MTLSRFDWTRIEQAGSSYIDAPDSVVPVTPADPAQGPRILFFSGGSAIREVSSALALSTERSIHIITTFDSGGSSAALRCFLNLPALGDLRSRISALADSSVPGVPEALKLWEYRLERDASEKVLRAALSSLSSKTHPYIGKMSVEVADSLLRLLSAFERGMPKGFDLRGACIGNLALAGGCLSFGSVGESVRYCSRMFRVRGIVEPVTEELAHLAVRYHSGLVCVGQHAFSGKSAELSKGEREGGIESMWFAAGLDDAAPREITASDSTLRHIRQADLICYPPGSFYSSLVANLMVRGVGQSIAANPAPKVFLPNPGADTELAGHSLRRQVEVILDALTADAPGLAPADVLDAVLVDSANGQYGEIPREWLAGLGIALLERDLVDAEMSVGPIIKVAPQKVSGLLMHIAQELCGAGW
ncbi:GAK system CofD-like protein [Desulfovibrio sp. OttesenSCG-928-C06]|nr:GAK system CofD-like protein [Desulfovibrio sp. OttesenSCG-928-C06]